MGKSLDTAMENARWLSPAWKCTAWWRIIPGNGFAAHPNMALKCYEWNVDNTRSMVGLRRTVRASGPRSSRLDLIEIQKLPSQGVPGCKSCYAHPSRTNQRACSLLPSSHKRYGVAAHSSIAHRGGRSLTNLPISQCLIRDLHRAPKLFEGDCYCQRCCGLRGGID